MAIRIDGPGRTGGIQGGQPTRRAEGTGATFTLPGETRAPTVAPSLGGHGERQELVARFTPASSGQGI